MRLFQLEVNSKCIAPDEVLTQHVWQACERGLPEVEAAEPHDGVAVLVGSGPSLDIERIRKETGTIVGIKDAHDWLIERGVVPKYALAVDPQESRARCFTPHQDVTYLVASQCHGAMLDHLAGHDVKLWHLYIGEEARVPPGKLMIGGGTTSGMRALTLFYVLGYRKFHLHGYDSCLTGLRLRANGTRAKAHDKLVWVRAGRGGRAWLCSPAMAGQAGELDRMYQIMPDITIEAYGEGLIPSIIEERRRLGVAA